MRFFKVEHSINPSEVGIFDQVQRFYVSPHTFEPHAFMDIPLEGKLDPKKKFPQLFLEKEAKWTDFLHIVPGAGNFLLVSPRTFSLILKHEVDVYQSYEVNVTREKEIYPYHLLRFVWPRDREYFDWDKSVFGHTTYMWREIIAEMHFKDYEEFYAFKKTLFQKKEHLVVRKLFLQEDTIKKDIFRLLFTSSGVYVSERLKDALQSEDITGCRFVPLEDLGERVTKENYPDMFDKKA